MNPSPGPKSGTSTPGPADCSLLGRAKLPRELSANAMSPTLNEDDFDVSISNIPEKLGLSPEFFEELEKVGGNRLDLFKNFLILIPQRVKVLGLGNFVKLKSSMIFILKL